MYAKIIDCIKANKYITIPELSKIIEKSEPTIHRHIDSLLKQKVLKRVGARKNGYWDIIK